MSLEEYVTEVTALATETLLDYKCAKTLNKAGWISLSIITRMKGWRLRRKIKQLNEKKKGVKDKNSMSYKEYNKMDHDK